MRVLLAGPDYEENLSIRYLSASLVSGGHDTLLAAFNSTVDGPAAANAAQSADLVGLSMCFQARAREFLGLAQRIKADDPKKVVVAGGHYASCAAEPLLTNHPEIDIIVIHEGERTLLEIVDAMPRLEDRLADIPGIAYRDGQGVRFTEPRSMLDDLDALPFPDRRGPAQLIAGVPTSYLMGSRGCYENCAYCCITTLHRLAPGKRFRQRNVERIADEMAALYRERGTRQFVFHDDNFLVPSEAINHARISAFEKALKLRRVEDIALVIKCRPADVNAKVFRRLKSLGLVRVFLGVESATARGLATLERHQSVEDSVRALETCSGLDISAQYTLMTFNPDTTMDTLRSDIAFMRRFSGNPFNFCRAEIYAGTPLERRMMDCGRARGNYLAREYSQLDPVVELAWNTALELLHSRCWDSSGLMQNAIGLDHMASALKRFHKGPEGEALARRIGSWVRAVNLDTIRLLNEVIEFSASAEGRANGGFQTAIRDLAERESTSRQEFLAEGMKLRAALYAPRFTGGSRQNNAPWPRLATKAAAALLVIGIPTTVGSQQAMAQQSTTAQPASAAGQKKSACSLAGSVTDPTGAVVANAKITIINVDTGAARDLTTGKAGQFAANDLIAGHYTVRAESPGFRMSQKTGIVLKAGASERVNVDLTVDIGLCEMVAVAMTVPKVSTNLYETKKPFMYVVGTAKDHGTYQGIAKLVYGDSNKWIQIFEANRWKIEKPEEIPNGTEVLIPPDKRVVPKLVFKVTPVYPREARKEHIWGDVLLDVRLKEDGTVQHAALIDGNPLLVEAATGAVEQWRYRPLRVKGVPVEQFVVVVSFGKDGKVR